MIEISRGKATHTDKLEKWLGAEEVARVSKAMDKFYWPIPVHGVPGKVFAMPGGDFAGEIETGVEYSALDKGDDLLQRMKREERARQWNRVNHPRFRRQHGAFASLSAVIAAATGGKAQNILFQKTGVASNAIGNSNDMWVRAGMPGAGAAGAAAPGGTAHTSASTGALPYLNGASTNSNHMVSGWLTASVINNTLLLYDRLFSVAKTMASTATEAVTGVPTRYQSTTASAVDYIGGNFVTIMNPTTVLAATAHNVTAASTAVWVYTNQDNTGSKNLNHNGTAIQTLAGVSACVVGGIDLAVGNWFIPLAAGDSGIKSLQQMQLSASVATGTLSAMIGHPIAFFPCPVANLVCPMDGINTAFNLTPILDNACLSFLEITKPATTATNYSGMITIVSE